MDDQKCQSLSQVFVLKHKAIIRGNVANILQIHASPLYHLIHVQKVESQFRYAENAHNCLLGCFCLTCMLASNDNVIEKEKVKIKM